MKLLNADRFPSQIEGQMKAASEEYSSRRKDFLSGFDYDYEISVTNLAQSPRSLLLARRHFDEIEVDARDRWFVTIGSVFHYLMEANPRPGDQIERRVGKILNSASGKKILVHGAADVINLSLGEIQDWKFCSMASLNYDKSDYIMQLSLLRWLLPDDEKKSITTLINHFCFRDWRSADKDGEVPFPTRSVIQPILPDDQIKSYLIRKVGAYLRNYSLPDNDLAFCAAEELWTSKSGFRIRKFLKTKGKENQLALSSSGWSETKDGAIALAKEKGIDRYELEETKGSPKKCLYCDARLFCNQYQQIKDTIK